MNMPGEVFRGLPSARPGVGPSYSGGVRRIRIAMAQLNVHVGDLDGNVARIVAAYDKASDAGADVVVFGELTVTGYPPEDLLHKPRFVIESEAALQRVAEHTNDRTVAVVGFPDAEHDLHNAAAVCCNGVVAGVYHKQLLPNFAVFDEQRYFSPGTFAGPLFEIAGIRVGVSICEDIWSPDGPVREQVAGGAELVLNINGSPYRQDKQNIREDMISTRAKDASVPVAYVNQIGGQDELVFDGGSIVFDQSGELLARSPQFEESLDVLDIEVPLPYRMRSLDPRGRPTSEPLPVVAVTSEPNDNDDILPGRIVPMADPIGEVWQALVLATRDYLGKNGFSEAVIGLSGGVDSSLVAALAVDALGAENVHGVSMPSRYSSDGSKDDAADLARNMGVDYRTIAIGPAHDALLSMLGPSFGEREPDTTEENLQSRIRGVTLMALSNKLGWMVLTTGNKSESAVGYSTLYGDTAGGFAVIKDCPKLLVYELCWWRNAQADGPWIPEPSITKPPSAELRPDQRDDQSLPPYEVLDPLLEQYVEMDRTADELIALGFDSDIVRRITRLVDIAEYKRRQSPPGPRISSKAFGKDRRLPITNAYR
jgi:NAD+ synthase (glutamine-hydrolysing)